jgi:4-hydroxy-tetrahydrodipicolinate synthase
MNYQYFKGTGVALITPFTIKSGKEMIDYPALERILEHVLVKGGVDYIVSLGTTGEAITLSSRECQNVLDFTIKQVNGRVPVVAGWFGSNSTDHLLERLKNVNLKGCAAVLSSSPAYNKPTQEGIYQHYLKAVKTAPIPMILYNVPSRTSSNVLPETLVRLANASPQFVGVKEASGNLVQAQYLLKHRPTEDFLVISGDDQITLGMIACGGDGVISVIANSHPVEFAGMVRAALKGDYHTAQFLNHQLHDIHPLLYAEGNPVGIKAAMAIKGLCENVVRLPLAKMSEGNFAKLKVEMEKAVLYAANKAVAV